MCKSQWNHSYVVLLLLSIYVAVMLYSLISVEVQLQHNVIVAFLVHVLCFSIGVPPF